MVISMVPYLNGAIAAAADEILPEAKFIVNVTDWNGDGKIWVSKSANQIVICNTVEAERAIRRQLGEQAKIYLSSGLIVNPEFYRLGKSLKKYKQMQGYFNLDISKKTVFCNYKFDSNKQVLRMLSRLEKLSDKIEVIMYDNFSAAVQKMWNSKSKLAVKWIKDEKDKINAFAVGDIYVGNAAPEQLGAALLCRMIVITESGSHDGASQKFNTDYIKKRKYGIVLKNLPDKLELTLKNLLNDKKQQKKIVARIDSAENHGIFESVRIVLGNLKKP